MLYEVKTINGVKTKVPLAETGVGNPICNFKTFSYNI